MERKRYIIGMLAALAIAGSAEAQVRAEQVEVKKEGRTVAVGFEVPGVPEDMRSRQKMVLRPYLYEGQDTLWLPAAQLYGKIRYKRERQEAALAGDREWTLGERDAMGKEDTLRYAAVASYERWMKQASLGIAYHYEGCGCECCDGHQVVGEDLPVYVAPVPVMEVTSEEPKRFEVVEAQKRWEFRKRNMQVFFSVGKSVLQPDAYGNRETLDEIMDAIRANEILRRKDDRKNNWIFWALAIVGAVVVIAGIAYAVYRYLTPDYLEDFDDDFDDDFEDDDPEEEKDGAKEEAAPEKKEEQAAEE